MLGLDPSIHAEALCFANVLQSDAFAFRLRMRTPRGSSASRKRGRAFARPLFLSRLSQFSSWR
ncbi:hypothetical protein RHECNPAF_8900103 [Rhizobium etli CNPAF512]|nr:hypothetical protein RHECNPAF_8900103 [Rhizobium etli CNPAF512]